MNAHRLAVESSRFLAARVLGLGTYHGLRRKHIDTYLNEFVFRYNRRFYRHVSFETLLGLAAHHVPASYWDIVNQENPRKGARIIRLAPRRRKTATGMRISDDSVAHPQADRAQIGLRYSRSLLTLTSDPRATPQRLTA